MPGRVTHRAARSCSAHGGASGAVDNPTSAKPHLTKSNSCPTKRGHLCQRLADSAAPAIVERLHQSVEATYWDRYLCYTPFVQCLRISLAPVDIDSFVDCVDCDLAHQS
jgi:hypothetical protein